MTEGVKRASKGERASDGDADPSRAGGYGSVTLVSEPVFQADAARQLDRALGSDTERSVLAILYRHGVRAWTTAVRDRCDRIDLAATVAVGPVAESDRGSDDAAVRTVSDPTDLTGVGIAVGEWLRAREDHERPVVCLDSLSTLLQYADLERTFRFLHALAAQIRSAGATAYVSVDPGAHDEATLGSLRTLFDAVVETDLQSGKGTASIPADAAEPPADPRAREVVTDGGGPEAADGVTTGSE